MVTRKSTAVTAVTPLLTVMSLALSMASPDVTHAQSTGISDPVHSTESSGSMMPMSFAADDPVTDDTGFESTLVRSFLSLLPRWVVVPNAAGFCECTQFVKNLMRWGDSISGYPTAASWATRSYWYRESRGWRYQLSQPKNGEFVIAKSPAWGTGSAGHIARVVSNPTLSGSNWVFEVEHANWGSTDRERRSGSTKANCNNVKRNWVSAPRSGGNITFWGR